jgi:spore coat protein H
MSYRRSGVLFGAFIVAGVMTFGRPASAAAQTQDDFFSDAVLQDVRLTISARDWQTLKDHADANTYYPVDVRWRGVTVRNAGLRSRGSGTRNGVKPGLRLDVNHYLTNQTFLGLKAFILDNTYSDETTVRESVTMKLFDRLGVPAPREAHARVYVNNEYAGVYVIVEDVDRAFVSRVFGAKEAQIETGGYLFEFHWLFDYHWEFLGPELENYAPLFRPQTRDTDSMSALYQPIEEMIRAINEASDEDFAASVGQYLDLRQFLKQLAVEAFVADWDGLLGNWGTNNFYVYRFRDGTRAQLIPWDKDNAFMFVDADVALRLQDSVLARRALAVPDLRRFYLDALNECARIAAEPNGDDTRGWLERELDRQLTLIDGAIAADGRFPFSLDDFHATGDFLRRFARLRPAFVQCQAANMADPEAPQQVCSVNPQ